MAWRYLPHQLNNRKFDKAVVFVHGLNGSVKSWMGAPNRFVDRLSRVPAIYNHIGLYVFGYDPKIFEHGPLWKLFARIPGCSEIAQQRKFNADFKRISTELKASLSEFLPGYKTIVLVGHGIGGLVIKRVLHDMHEPPKTYSIDLADPDNHVAYNKVLALLHDILYFADHKSRHAKNLPNPPDPDLYPLPPSPDKDL